MMLDIKNIWADIWFKAKIKYQLFFYVRDRSVQARACLSCQKTCGFFGIWGLAPHCDAKLVPLGAVRISLVFCGKRSGSMCFPRHMSVKKRNDKQKVRDGKLFWQTVQARACFFVGRSQALERRRTIRNRAFRHSGSEKKFLKKLFKNLLTLPRWSGIL